MVRPYPVLLVVVLASSRAAATQIDTACPRLGADQVPELAARARLTLRTTSTPPARVSVECDATHAQVVWDGPPVERLAVDERDGLVEGVLQVLERRARGKRRSEPAPVAAPVADAPDLDASPPVPSRAPGSRWRRTPPSPGGFGLAASSATWTRRAGTGVGGRLDVGVGLGALVPAASEQLLGGIGGDISLWSFTTALGVAWGAPWDARRHFGASALVGFEWFSGPGRQSESTPMLDLGVRAATVAGPLAYWVGIDARARAAPETLGDPVNVELPRVSASLSIGAVLLVDPAP